MFKATRVMLLIVSVCLPAICLAVNAVPKDSTKQAPAAIIINPASRARIDFVSDTWDFGSIPKGSIVLHNFKIHNVGQDTLIISNVKPSCGCTTAPLSDSLVAPGGEAGIMATFNTKNFNGRITKQIFVDSNDPIKPYNKVIFSATINNPLLTITPSPTEADFGKVKIGAPAQIKITISNDDNTKADLAIVEESAPSKEKVTLTKTSVPSKGKTELVLDLLPQSKAEVINQSITLEAGNIAGSRFTIPWKAEIIQ